MARYSLRAAGSATAGRPADIDENTEERADPFRDAGLTPEEAARIRACAGRDTWVTRDGRELTIEEMYRPHLGNAQAVLSTWIKREKDPEKKRELKSWRAKMRRELVKREKAWRAKRKRDREAS